MLYENLGAKIADRRLFKFVLCLLLAVALSAHVSCAAPADGVSAADDTSSVSAVAQEQDANVPPTTSISDTGSANPTSQAPGTLTINISDDAAIDDIQALQDYIAGLPEVTDVTHVTKEMAFERMKQSVKGCIANTVDEFQLPAYLEVGVANAKQSEQLATTISEHEKFLSVIYTPDNPKHSLIY